MVKKRTLISVDNEGDILLIGKCDSYPEQLCEELRDDIVIRMHPISRDIELIQIMNFSERFAANDVFELPIIASFMASESSCHGRSGSNVDLAP